MFPSSSGVSLHTGLSAERVLNLCEEWGFRTKFVVSGDTITIDIKNPPDQEKFSARVVISPRTMIFSRPDSGDGDEAFVITVQNFFLGDAEIKCFLGVALD